eukprot:6160260-Alexandrium_andersonii.AAC.1
MAHGACPWTASAACDGVPPTARRKDALDCGWAARTRGLPATATRAEAAAKYWPEAVPVRGCRGGAET